MALADVFKTIAGPDAPVEFVAYDGSRAGAEDSPIRITVRSPAAVSYLAQAPGALGLARAYVSGHLDVDGDMYTALARLSKAQTMEVGVAERARLLRDLGGARVLCPRLAPPPQEVQVNRRWLTGLRHSKGRDATAISHHYDVSNRFYEWVLGPSMAYTCACYPTADATLEEAQAHKLALAAPRRRAGGPVRPGRGPPPGLPGRARDRLRRGQLDRPDRAHRHAPAARLLSVPAGQAQARGPPAQPLHHPPGQHRARGPQGRVHQPVRVPRRRAGGPRLPDLAHERHRLRDPARGEPARALRQDPGRLVRQPRRTLEGSGRRGR